MAVLEADGVEIPVTMMQEMARPRIAGRGETAGPVVTGQRVIVLSSP